LSNFLIDFFSTGKGIIKEIHASTSNHHVKIQSIIPIDEISRLRLYGDPLNVWDKAILNGIQPTALGKIDAEEIKIVDLFCGCGGFTEGVKRALSSLGYKPVVTAAIDIDKEALGLYQANHNPDIALNADVNSVVKYRTRRAAHGGIEFADVRYEINDVGAIEILMQGCDVLLAGPPCQGHSNLNNHSRRSDPRNNLYMTVAAYAYMLHPKFVVIENVQPVLHDKQDVVSKTEGLLKKLGYNVSHLTVDGTSVGMSQTRKRHFLFASLSQVLTISEYYDKYKRLYPPPSRSVSWCFELLPKVVDVENPFYMPSELSAENQLRVSWLHENSEFDLPNKLRPKCHQQEHNYKSVYGRMIPHLPAGTITTGYHSPGRGRYIHPWEPRCITSCEAALIQGFPVNYKFYDGKAKISRASHAKVIGDAVSPIMSRFIGMFIGVETHLSDAIRANNHIHA